MSRFSFLRKDFSKLYEKCIAVENFKDIASALLKARQVLEYLVENMGMSRGELFGNINTLLADKVLNKSISRLFHDLRMLTNKGVHHNSSIEINEMDKNVAIDLLLEICIWYAVCNQNKDYSLLDFEYNDLSIAKKYIRKDFDKREVLNLDYNNPLESTRKFTYECIEEVNPLYKKVFETSDEYEKRILNLPRVDMGYAILDARTTYGDSRIQIIQAHIDIDASVDLIKDDIYFFAENISSNDIIDGRLKAFVKTIDGKLYCDYSSFVLYTDDIEIPIKFICWNKLDIESEEQFHERINALPSLPLAECWPIYKEYDSDKEVLTFESAPLKYSQKLCLKEKIRIYCPIDRAKVICNQTAPIYVMGKLSAYLQLDKYFLWNKDIGVISDGIAERNKKINDLLTQADKMESFEEKFICYKKAAELGDVSSQCKIGVCYYIGNGIEQSYTKAVYWFDLSAEQGYSAAQYNLACCYASGLGVEKDYYKAVYWFNLSAEQGYTKAQKRLGDCYYYGNGVLQDERCAMYWYGISAKQGCAEAQNRLGFAYEYGRGLYIDYEEAVYWYKKAVEQDNIDAQYNLGRCYILGKGVEADYRKGLELYKKAENKGNKEVYQIIKNMCTDGMIVNKDDAKFLKYLVEKIEKAYLGDLGAMEELGDYYLLDFYEDSNLREALRWYHKASEQGSSLAMRRLGDCYSVDYERGLCGPEKAIEWYSMAGKCGDGKAMRELAIFYEGLGYHVKAAECYGACKKLLGDIEYKLSESMHLAMMKLVEKK